ncbi:hypothetical protein JW935_15675, partial [candidate division KSB1 bacterium]|nr:hypothetical protein [candidate division KSB1 bacterium]
MINRQLCLFLLIIMGMTPVKKAGWLSVCCRIARAEKFTSPDSTGFGRKNPDELKIHNNPDSTEVLNSPDPDTLQSSPTDSIQHHVSVTADSLPDSTATTGADSLRTPPADTLGILDMLIKKEPVMQRLSADSTLFQGSIYGSFADILDQMPAVFIFQRGSVGQLANGFLFSGIGSNFILDYDGLILNDPLTG